MDLSLSAAMYRRAKLRNSTLSLMRRLTMSISWFVLHFSVESEIVEMHVLGMFQELCICSSCDLNLILFLNTIFPVCSRNLPCLFLECAQNGFVLGGRYSARGATFTFDNQQNVILDIDKIDCSGEQSCSGARFITGPNVQIGEITCSSNSCSNCLVQFDAADSGIPCDPSQGAGSSVWQQQQPWNAPPAPAAQPPGPWIVV